MLNFNILKWCDEKITYLKSSDIRFVDGMPQIPENFLYTDYPIDVVPYCFRKQVEVADKNKTLLAFYMLEKYLWPRLSKIDSDINEMKNYAGIVGFDLSPSVGMLRPRQLLSILVNSIYDCYVGSKGVKVMPNYRAGDFGTICFADCFPDNKPFMIGNLGCNNNGFKEYGLYQLGIILRKKKPGTLYMFGGISKSNALMLIRKYGVELIGFADNRSRKRNGYESYRYCLSENTLIKENYPKMKGGEANNGS